MAQLGYVSIEGKTQGKISAGATTVASVGALYQANHDDECQVFSLETNVIRAYTPGSIAPSGNRTHMPTTITKPTDKATPLLYRALATGEHLTLEMKLFRVSAEGLGEEFFVIKWEDAILVEGKTIMADVTDDATSDLTIMDKFSFTYQKVTWDNKSGGTMSVDSWQDPSQS